MSTSKAQAVYLQGNLMRHVVVTSLTSSIGMMAIFIVDLVDMLFISMLGNAALAAAIGYAGTVLFFTTSISIGLSVAAGALVARAIGQGEEEEAREYATSVLMAGAVLALVTVVLVWLSREWLLQLLGAEGETLRLALQYLSIILPSMPILLAAMVAGAVLRAHGDAKRAMYATLAGGIVNAILDPIFIFGFGLDLQGAAIASVFARAAVLIVGLWPAIKIYNGFAAPKLIFFIRDFKAVSSIAFPSILANVATPIGSAIVIREMSKFGADAVAGMAIIGRLTPVAFAVVFSLSGAIGPIIGQNAGANNFDRVRKGYKNALQFSTLFVIFVALVLFLLRAPIANLFEAEGVTRSLVFLFCGPLALMWVFNSFIFVGNAAFNNLKHPFYSTWINWGRSTIGTWPFVIAGASLWGASGVLIGQAIGGFIFAVVSLWLAQKLLSENGSQDRKGHHGGHFMDHLREHVLHSRRH